MTLSRRSSTRDTLAMNRQSKLSKMTMFAQKKIAPKQAINDKSSSESDKISNKAIKSCTAQYGGVEKIACGRVICRRRVSRVLRRTCVLIRIFRKSWLVDGCVIKEDSGRYLPQDCQETNGSFISACLQ